MMMRRHLEKRQQKRLKAYNLFKILDEKGADKGVFNIDDFSEGGIGFHSSQPFPDNASFKMLLNLPVQGKDIAAEAEVRWTRRIFGKRGYRVGVRFTQIREHDRALIRSIVERCDLSSVTAR